jgi:hypothetical protein
MRRARLWPWLLVSAVVAVWIDLGTLHRDHQADSLVPVLVSLQRWTPFLWSQDRIGMLVPLLAIPFRNPLANLLVQEGLYVLGGLAAVFLLMRYVLRDVIFPLVAAVSAALFLCLAPAEYRFMFFSGTFYGLWLALGLGGLLLAETPVAGRLSLPRCCGAFGLLVLAHWVFTAAGLVLGPLVVFRSLFCPAMAGQCVDCGVPARSRLRQSIYEAWRRIRTEGGTELVLLALAFGVGLILMTLCPDHQLDVRGVSAAQWPDAWQRFAVTTWNALAPHHWPFGLVLTAGAGMACWWLPQVRRHAMAGVRAAGALAAAGVIFGLYMGTTLWVQSDCDARYWMPAVFLLQAALVVLAVAPVCSTLGRRFSSGLNLLVAPSLLLAASYSYGLPSLVGVRADLDRRWGALAHEVVGARCTHVAGDYWTVWPLVFSASQILAERGEDRPVWGITYRCGPTQPFGVQTPRDQLRVAVMVGERQKADPWLAGYGLPALQVKEERSGIWVLAAVPD